MPSKQNEIHEANEAFYRAFERLDVGEMEKIWLKESYIQCIHPGWRLVKGWEAVMASWRQIFENTQEMRFLLTEVWMEVRDSIAWVTVYENITSRTEEETSTGVVLATNIYESRPGGWFLIHHHGSPTMGSQADSDTTFH